MLQRIRVARGGSSFQPELAQLGFPITRAEGKALTTTPGGAEIYDDGMIDLLLREDGGIRLICGRGTGFHTPQTFPRTDPIPVVFPDLVSELTQSLVALAGQIGDQHAAYQGQWQIGIRMDRLRGTQPWNKVQNPMTWPATPTTGTTTSASPRQRPNSSSTPLQTSPTRSSRPSYAAWAPPARPQDNFTQDRTKAHSS